MGWEHMVKVGVSRAVRGESTDGLDGSEIWERVRSQERKRCFFLFYI